MADAELIAHQESWKFFTKLLKYGIASVVVVLVLLAVTVVR